MAQTEPGGDTGDRGEAVRRWRALLGRSRVRDRAVGVASPIAPSQRTGDVPRSGAAERPGGVANGAGGVPAVTAGDTLLAVPTITPIDTRLPAQVLAALRRSVGAPRSLAFVNPKGGVHKTTATVLAAATLGTARGGGVLAWDDNELRGTLGLRAGTARHARTVKHLIGDLVAVETAPQRREALENYLRHAADGSFDVLAGDEDPRVARHLDPTTVRRLLTVLTRVYDIICVDTGNNVESPNWRTIVETTDRLVVTTLPREDAAFTADWMLDLLEEDGHADLVADAVTVLSCPSPQPSTLLDELVEHFSRRCRAVAVIPYDPALESGSTIAFSAIAESTRLAWLYAAAAMIESLPPPRR